MSIDGIGLDWGRSNATPPWKADDTEKSVGDSETALSVVNVQDAESLAEPTRYESINEIEGPKTLAEPQARPGETELSEHEADRRRLRGIAHVFQRVLKELQTLPVFADLVEAAIPDALREENPEHNPGLGDESVRHEDPARASELHVHEARPTFDRKV